MNIKYADALATADHHTLAKHGIKEIAHQRGYAATFIPKWHQDRVGSASHVHQSLFSNGSNVFFDAKKPLSKSAVMDHYMAGLLKYAPDITVFMAPMLIVISDLPKVLLRQLAQFGPSITEQPLLDWLAKAVSLYVLNAEYLDLI